jgi:hypothetical protein
VITRELHPTMTYGHDAVLVRPDRYIAAAGTVDEVRAAGHVGEPGSAATEQSS